MEKKFDAVQIVRDIRDKIYEDTKDKTDEELIIYYKKKADIARSVQEKRSEYLGKDEV
jgi:hypothetical protein